MISLHDGDFGGQEGWDGRFDERKPGWWVCCFEGMASRFLVIVFIGV